MRSALFLLLLLTPLVKADEPLCGTGPENDARLLALHDRPRSRAAVAANAEANPPLLRDGVFYVGTDEVNTFNYRPMDLVGQSLVFEPRAGSKFAVRRQPIRYLHPSDPELRDFDKNSHYVIYDLQSFTFPLFGNSVSRLYLSAFNGIHLSPPGDVGAMQFNDLEAAVYRQPLLSPLMITSRKPGRLRYPKLYVNESADAVVITWRSTGGRPFAYDVQAELRKDGTIVYSYGSLDSMRWGAPIISSGFDPAAAIRRTLGGADDARRDISSDAVPRLADMADIRRVDVQRINESDLYVIRVKTGAAIDLKLIGAGQGLRYIVQFAGGQAWLDIDLNGWTVTPFFSARSVTNGASVAIDGDTVEIYGVQLPADVAASMTLRVWSYTRPSTRVIDFASTTIDIDAAPKRIATDLSSVEAGSELALPITEPFVLGSLDPYALWNQVQPVFGLSDHDIDGVAIYQSFFTDLIFFAGAYSTVGNPQVEGIRAPSSFYGPAVPRGPALLHMNQIKYGWNEEAQAASQVVLHELGHRWLYFINIREGDQNTRSLNPVSPHPAGYVHTPSAFRVLYNEESSVMGGAYFTAQSDGSFRARALNKGFSWADLYLMGLAAPEEVPPWFYLADTDPPLPLEYWPVDGAVVRGDQRQVSVDQIVAAHGERYPSSAMSQKLFRVVFVLVTEHGGEPSREEMRKMNEWRALLEKDFFTATGGRGRVVASWVRGTKKRPVR